MIFEYYLAICMVIMLGCLLYCGRIYQIPFWKVLIIGVSITVSADLGAHLMGFVELGIWSGRSIYGGLFFTPLFMWLVAKLIRVSYADVMDLSAPGGLILISLLKLRCYFDGCCYGRIIYSNYGPSFRFPSQIVECVTALILAAIIVLMLRKRKWRGTLCAYFFVLYGSTRFILNFFRATRPWFGPFASGTIWSVVAVVIGIAWILLYRRKQAIQISAKGTATKGGGSLD